MTQTLEKYLLDAERAFADQEYLQGKELLQDALAYEPTYGKAHNHLGWLYLYHLKDYEKAESHLRLALKYCPGYGATYQNMSTVLFEAKRLEEHKQLLLEAKDVYGISNSFIFNELGRNSEVSGNYREALKWYRLGVRWSVDEQELMILKENISRCRSKKWYFLIHFLP